MLVTLDDYFSNPLASSFKIIVDDPLSSKNTNDGKGLKDEVVLNNTKKRVEVT